MIGGNVPAENRKVRVAILGCKGIPASYGGFETFAQELSTRLAKRGVDVTVYAEAEWSKTSDEKFNGVSVRFRWKPKWGGISALIYDLICLWDARKKYDLIYLLGYGAAWGCILPRFYGAAVWINPDGLEWARAKWGRLVRMYFQAMEWLTCRVATRVIADSRAIADRMCRGYTGRVPFTFIPYGADLVYPGSFGCEVLTRWNLRRNSYFLIVARIEPENNIEEIIRGHMAYDGQLPLVIVGDIDGGAPYQKKIREIYFGSGQIFFLGGVYDNPALKALRLNAAAYIHGHSVGGTNPSLLEGMACGNWIIAHDNQFNKEVARSDAEYFSTISELSEKMREAELLSDADRLARAIRVRERITSCYTWQAVADAYFNLIDYDL